MSEEKQGAAEWLRGIVEEYEAEESISCVKLAKMFGIDCSKNTCRECDTKKMRFIADRIEADADELRGLRDENEKLRDMVRERQLPDGIEWPRFEDGELVKFGDEVGSDEPFTADGIAFESESERWFIKASSRSACGYFHGRFGEPVVRPAPKVLDADGVPIKVGDTVRLLSGSGLAFTVVKVDVNGGDHAVDIENAAKGISLPSVNPARLTHESADSWWLWGEDLDMAVKAGEVDKVEMVHRAKALAKGDRR